MRWRLLLAAAFALVFVLALAIVSPIGHPVDVDVAVARWMASVRGDAGIAIFDALSFVGSIVFMVPLAFVLAAYLVRRGGGWIPVAWLAIAMVGAFVLYTVLNGAFERPRPPMGIRVHEDVAWSFPSGHSTQAMAFWTIAAVLVTQDRPRRVRVIVRVVAAALVVAIGLSRVYLCAHWTMDVLGGFALGAAWVTLVLALRARVMGRR